MSGLAEILNVLSLAVPQLYGDVSYLLLQPTAFTPGYQPAATSTSPGGRQRKERNRQFVLMSSWQRSLIRIGNSKAKFPVAYIIYGHIANAGEVPPLMTGGIKKRLNVSIFIFIHQLHFQSPVAGNGFSSQHLVGLAGLSYLSIQDPGDVVTGSGSIFAFWLVLNAIDGDG